MPTSDSINITVCVPSKDVAKLYGFIAGLWDPAFLSTPMGPALLSTPVGAFRPPTEALQASPPPAAPMATVATPLPAPPAKELAPVQGVIETPETPPVATTPAPASSAGGVDPTPIIDPDVWRNCTNAKDVVDVIMNREGYGAFDTVLARFKQVRASNLCKAASVIPDDKVEARVKLNYQALGGAPF